MAAGTAESSSSSLPTRGSGGNDTSEPPELAQAPRLTKPSANARIWCYELVNRRLFAFRSLWAAVPVLLHCFVFG